MKLRFLELDVRVSELQTSRVSVASWEYPVLQAVWGDSVSMVNEVLIDRDPPDPADEFRRLANRYGSAEVEGAPFVSAVYGQFGPGVAALATAIREGTYEGDIVTSERPASRVPAAGLVPDNVANRVNELEKELAEAKALQADLAVDQEKNGNSPLSEGEIAMVTAAAPDKLSEAILDASHGKPLSDDDLVDLIGDGEPSAA